MCLIGESMKVLIFACKNMYSFVEDVYNGHLNIYRYLDSTFEQAMDINQVTIKNWDDYEAVLVESRFPYYTPAFLNAIKSRIKCPMIGRIQYKLDSYICNPDRFYNKCLPFLQIYDGLSATDKYEMEMLKHLSGKPVKFIGHTVEMDAIEFKNRKERKAEIVTCQQFTDHNPYAAIILAKNSGLQHIDFLTQNHTPQQRDQEQQYYAKLGHANVLIPKSTYHKYLDRLSHCKMAVNMEPNHNGSKFVVDCAMMGVPCIGSNTVSTMQILFPTLAIDPYNMDAAVEYMHRLQNDPVNYSNIIKYAQEKVKFFHARQGAERFKELVKEVQI